MYSPLKLLGALAAIAISVPVIVYTVAQEGVPPPPPPPPPPPTSQPAAPPQGSPGPMGPAMGAAPIVTGNQIGAQPAPGAPAGPMFGPAPMGTGMMSPTSATTAPMGNQQTGPMFGPAPMGPTGTMTGPMGNQQTGPVGPMFGPMNCLPLPSTPLQCASGEYSYYPPTTDPNACPAQPYCKRMDTSQFPQQGMMPTGTCPTPTPPQCGPGMHPFYPPTPSGGGCPPSPYCKSSTDMTQPGQMPQCPSTTSPQCGPGQYVYYPPSTSVSACPPVPYCRGKDDMQQLTPCKYYPPPSAPCATGEYIYYPPLSGGCTGEPYCKKTESPQPLPAEGLTTEKCTIAAECRSKPAGWCDMFYGYCRYPVSMPSTDTTMPNGCPLVTFPTCGNGQYLHYPSTTSANKCPVSPICVGKSQIPPKPMSDQQYPQPYPDQQQPMPSEMGTMPVPKQELKWAQRDVKQLVKDLNRASTLVKKVSPALQQEADALAKQVEGYKATFAGKEVTQEQMQEYRDAMMQDAMQGIRTRAETLQMLSKEVPRELKRVRGASDQLTKLLARKSTVTKGVTIADDLKIVGVDIASLTQGDEAGSAAAEVEALYSAAVKTPTMENIETAQQALQGLREEQRSPDEDRERMMLSQAVTQFNNTYAKPLIRVKDEELRTALLNELTSVIEALNSGDGEEALRASREDITPQLRSLISRARNASSATKAKILQTLAL